MNTSNMYRWNIEQYFRYFDAEQRKKRINRDRIEKEKRIVHFRGMIGNGKGRRQYFMERFTTTRVVC